MKKFPYRLIFAFCAIFALQSCHLSGSETNADQCRDLYEQGVQLHRLCQYAEAMRPLKQAELLLDETVDCKTAGMIYMLQGSVLELHDYLWQEAEEKYRMALPYFEQADDTVRMACCHRDIARMSLWRQDTVAYEEHFLMAIDLVSQTDNRLFYCDICAQYYLNHTPADTLRLMALNEELCDSFGIYRYAYLPVEYHLSRGHLAEAERALSLYARDSAYTTWSRDEYDYLHSAILAARGQDAAAYRDLRRLYLHKTQQTYEDGLSRTYAIARQYDIEREQHRLEQLMLERRMLWLGVVGLMVLLIMAAVVAWLISRVHKARMMQIDSELRARRESLQRMLKQRVELTRQVRHMAENSRSKLPAWLQEYLDGNTFVNQETWELFLREFNDLYGNLLDRLQEQYPSLSDKDMQYIALAVLGMDVNDICYLLGTTDRTIWNRRQKIRNRVGQSHANLEEWLQTLVMVGGC